MLWSEPDEGPSGISVRRTHEMKGITATHEGDRMISLIYNREWQGWRDTKED